MVQLLCIFGEKLISISEDRILKIWNISTHNEEGEIILAGDFTPTAILHPSTYLNKILIGSKEGAMQLWNIRTRKLIHAFRGWNSQINCFDQPSVVDVVGIGLENGQIVIHNIRQDKTVAVFTQGEGSVSCISFRTGKHFNISQFFIEFQR
jgi:U3 small nucleolar RNA-associated protein 21